MSTWDAIVIGGGHNGLVAGTYLARAGAGTVVLEARDKVGGAAATDAPWPEAPEIKVTRLSYVMSLMPPRIIDDLELERHGYKLFPMGPAYQAWPDGRSLTLYDDDARRNAEQLARFSKKDAEAMPRWDAWLEGLAAVLGPLLTRTPPKIGSGRPSDLADLLRLAWRYRGLDVRTVGDVTRLMTTSVSDLLDDWFESEEVKATLAINGVIGTWAGPESPGTAYVMAHHSIGDVGDGHLGSWGFPEGGMGAVADAIHRSPPARSCTPRWWSPPSTPASPSSSRSTGPSCRRTSSPTRALAVAQRRGQDQPRPGRAARLHRRPRRRGRRAPHRGDRHGPVGRLHRAGVPGRQAGPSRGPAVLGRLHPHGVRQDPGPRGRPRHVAVHPVGPARVVRGAARQGAGGLRRPDDRLLRRAGPQPQGRDPAP